MKPKGVLGTPFGSDAVILQFLTETTSEASRPAVSAGTTSGSTGCPHATTLLPGCSKDNHLLWVLTFVEETEHDLRARSPSTFTLDCILARCLPDAAKKQCFLPICSGGFGVQNPTVARSAAYLLLRSLQKGKRPRDLSSALGCLHGVGWLHFCHLRRLSKISSSLKIIGLTRGTSSLFSSFRQDPSR